ncbi:MAG TPA: twin-arginine translocation signal domain-containing protein [Nocardioidaceae bacterium]|nr:twin-arginine translocation signal domain-containing protein [Nocardioidaceae bacterium]
MTAPEGVSRRVFLAGVGLAGAALVSGCWPGSSQNPTQRPTKESAIFDLSFEITDRFRPFDLVAPGFVADAHESAGVLAELVHSASGPEAPFAAVEVEVTDAADGVVLAGLATASGDHVAAVYDAARQRVAISVRRAGRTKQVRRKKTDLTGSFRLGFALCENQVTVLADTGDGWRPLLTERDRVAALVDLRSADVLDDFRYAWGPGSATPVQLGNVRAGLFGMTGVRDPHLVQHSDGRPYVRGGKAYFTVTCAGLGFFQQAHWGVFTLDLADPTRLEQVAQLFTRRDGLLLGDHAGQVVRDEDNDTWIVATSSWGDFSFDGVHVRHLTTRDDVLSGVHLLETEPTPLPTSVSSWDPALTRIDGRWHVAFVESPSQDPFDFHPALARGPHGAGWAEGLEPVGAATDLHQCEGPILSRVGERWWLLASDGDNRLYPVFDLDMHRVGRLDAPYPSNIPHPQIVPLPHGGHLLVTFDGTPYAKRMMKYGGHGDVVVMRSS